MNRRWTSWCACLVLVGSSAACGGDAAAHDDAAPGSDGPDGSTSCQALGATGQFIKRAGNPRMRAGAAFSDGKLDVAISDPDVRWDAGSQRWDLYYASAHALTFGDPRTEMIRRGTSSDRMTWSVDDAPVLAAATDGVAWDSVHLGAPTVVFDPNAAADRRYLLLYAGAKAVFPYPGYAFPELSIGAAFSADGIHFTRISAAESPHNEAGLVLTGHDAYPIAVGAIVADPELALVNGVYHLWFSSFACKGIACATASARGVSHATSADGIHWQVLEAPVRSLLRASADEATGGGQPSVIYDATHCRWEMWLTSDLPAEQDDQPIDLENMAGVWHADSADGVSWHINYVFARELAWSQAASGEHLGLRTGADVGDDGSGRLMLYTGFDDQAVPAGFTLPDRTAAGSRPGVMTLNVATRDLP